MTDLDVGVAASRPGHRARRRRFSHSDRGTDEREWAEVLDAALTVHFADLGELRRVVVVAPHPDDESLGAGGLIASCSAADIDVVVVVCTDGEAGLRPGVADRSIRTVELRDAVDELSVGRPVGVVRLGLPDGRLAAHRAEMLAALEELVRTADLVVAPWPGDGHPDHEAVGSVVRVAAAGQNLLEYPVWAWHWGRPEVFADVDVVTVPISPSARRAKVAAIERHASQSAGDDPILNDRVLAHFRRDIEAFVVAAGTLDRIEAVDRSSSAFFDSLYRFSPSRDPWDLGDNPIDPAKTDAVAALVRPEVHRRVLEVGCGPGFLTERLGRTAVSVLAVDSSAAAVEVARDRCRGLDGVELRVAHVPDDLRPDDMDFDLVVLSDVGYYFDLDGLRCLVADLRERTSHGAGLIAAHWSGPAPDHRIGADAVHRIIDSELGWRRCSTGSLPQHRLDLWTRR